MWGIKRVDGTQETVDRAELAYINSQMEYNKY